MPKHKIYITRKIPANAILALKKAGFAVDYFPRADILIPRQTLLKKVKGCSAILSLLTDPIDAKVMDAAGPKLKIISNYAVGFDNIDVAEAKKRKIIVTNTPCEEVSEAVAEMAMTMVMALSRKIIPADEYTKSGKYKGWDPMLLLGNSLMGKTLGIVGLGRIGAGLAHRAADGFGLKIIYNDIRRNPEFEKRYGAKYVSQEKLLRTADFVSLHVPLLPSTRHLISTKELKMMGKTAYLINTARGPIVDELALNKALLRGDIAGAAIDVYECEPTIDCRPYDAYSLKKLDNIIMTPHIASASVEARNKMSEIAVKNIINVLRGKKPLTPAK
ncbi:MAG: D-glycerate dehydrogenase [Patescibacteria group bacterium]|nr:D-glycerate dehydrogenase [Patescibacteria group bacterium]MDD5490936.1 D-glycerate dehydrogenase [Patescibacteria group bacterium]